MSRHFARKTQLTTALSILLLASITPAAQTCQPCMAKQPKQSKPAPVSEKPTLDLVEKLSQQPELLCTQYLQYILGRPAKRHLIDQTTTVYHWVANEGGIGTQDCELWETRDANHRLTRSIFKVNLPHSQTSITDIEKRLTGDADTLSTKYPMPPNYASSDAGNSASPASSAGPANSSNPSYLSTNVPNGAPAGAPSNVPSSILGGTASSAATPIATPTAPPSVPNISGMTGAGIPPMTLQSATPGGSTAPTSPAMTGNLGSIANQFPQKIVPRMAAKHLFDQQCRPSLQFSFVPYTNVFYTQAPNTFHVHHAEVVYNGPPLPPPSQNDVAIVAQEMRLRALTHHAKDSHNLAVPMLSDHLIDNPGDAEAHYALGLSYQKSSNLNAAISEYQLALRYSNGDQNVANKALQSLQQLQVLPSPNDQIQYHTLRFKQDGQGLMEGDVIASQDRQSLLASGKPAFYSTNTPPIATSTSGTGYSAANPGNGPYNGVRPTSFYDRMTYGNNLFPAMAPNLPGSSYNPSLEPGF
ncbi:MAG TPA: hypothetical protein V6C97_13715 [Oculatellaceae cyanobacterium]